MKVEKIITKTDDLDIVDATIFSTEEAEKLPIRLRQYNNWWWLRSPDGDRSGVSHVFRDGSVYKYGYYVIGAYDAVRPVLKIKNLESSNLQIGDMFIFGEKKFEIVSNETAFCLEDIGTCAFRKDWDTEDAEDYETSDVKKFIDEWFEKASNADAKS